MQCTCDAGFALDFAIPSFAGFLQNANLVMALVKHVFTKSPGSSSKVHTPRLSLKSVQRIKVVTIRCKVQTGRMRKKLGKFRETRSGDAILPCRRYLVRRVA